VTGAIVAEGGASVLATWYFQLPNFLLAALMYTLLGRALLGLIVDPNSSNYIWRFFCKITDPFIAVISYVTPKATAPVVIWLFGVVWLFWLRIGLLYLFLLLGAFSRAG
jgi:YggT family protein